MTTTVFAEYMSFKIQITALAEAGEKVVYVKVVSDDPVFRMRHGPLGLSLSLGPLASDQDGVVAMAVAEAKRQIDCYLIQTRRSSEGRPAGVHSPTPRR